jgi:hypothetical protein
MVLSTALALLIGCICDPIMNILSLIWDLDAVAIVRQLKTSFFGHPLPPPAFISLGRKEKMDNAGFIRRDHDQ